MGEWVVLFPMQYADRCCGVEVPVARFYGAQVLHDLVVSLSPRSNLNESELERDLLCVLVFLLRLRSCQRTEDAVVIVGA